MANKAHTATLNRICRKYGLQANSDGQPYDIQTCELIIEVETSASVPEAVKRLDSLPSPVYIAVTNKEGIGFAELHVQGTSIGLLDPQGNVIRPSEHHKFSR